MEMRRLLLLWRSAGIATLVPCIFITSCKHKDHSLSIPSQPFKDLSDPLL